MVSHDRFTDLRHPPSAIARSPMIEHDIMRRVREWMAGGPPPHGLPFSSANLQTRGAQLRTALTKPPFSWIDHLIRPLQERRGDRQAKDLGGLEVDHSSERAVTSAPGIVTKIQCVGRNCVWWRMANPAAASSHAQSSGLYLLCTGNRRKP